MLRTIYIVKRFSIIVSVYFCLDFLTVQIIPYMSPDTAAIIGLKSDARQARTTPPITIGFPGFYSMRPGFSGSIGWGPYPSEPYFTNSLGFKDSAPRNVPLHTSGRRVLVLGDSFTEGVGMPWEKTFVGLLEARLSEIEFLNAAVQGYSPRHYAAKTRYLWNHVGLRFDQAIVFIDVSDVPNESNSDRCRDQRGSEHAPPRPPNKSRGPKLKPTQAHQETDTKPPPNNTDKTENILSQAKTVLKEYTLIGRLLNLAKDEVNYRYIRKGLRNVNWSLSLWTLDPRFFLACGSGISNAKQYMNDLASFLWTIGVPLTLVVYPWPDQIFHADNQSRQVQIWGEWSAKVGSGFINLFPIFFKQGTPRSAIEKLYLRDDVHFSEIGHRLVADALEEQWR